MHLPKDTHEEVTELAVGPGLGWKGSAHLTSQMHGLLGNPSGPSVLTQAGGDKADTGLVS